MTGGFNGEITGSPEETIPRDVKSELTKKAKELASLGDTMEGIPLINVPGTPAYRVARDLVCL